MRQLTRTAWITIAALVAVAILGLSVSAYIMLYLGVDRAASERAALVEEAELLETQNARTTNIRSLIRNNAQVRDELDTFFVKEDDVVTFFDELEKLGILAGVLVSIDSVTLGNSVDKDGLVDELKLTLTAEGSIAELFHLLSLLEQFPKALFVEQSMFTQHPTDLTWRGNYQLVLIRLKEITDS